MKKIYLAAGALGLAGMVSAQTGFQTLRPQNTVADQTIKHSYKMKDAQHPSGTSFSERGGTVYFSEDFENGLTGNFGGTQTATGAWTTVIVTGVVGWETTTTGHANDAGSTFNIPPLMSTTGSGTGGTWMLLDSDSDGTSGSSEEATLTSPTIDFGSLTPGTPLALEWQQFFAEWQADSLHIEVSTDGGTTWNGVVVSDGVGRDNRPNPENMRVNITPYNVAGSSTVQIRFRWTGNWDYGWQLDDVKIVDLPPDNLVLANSWMTHNTVHPLAVSAGFSDKITYTKVPTTQLFDVSFRASVSNLGADDQTGTMVNVTTNQAYSGASNSFGILTGQTTDTTIMPDMTLPATTGVVEAYFDITYADIANELNTDGLKDTTMLEVTDYIFSRDDNFYTGAGLWNGESGGSSNAFEMGQVYQIANNATLTGVDIVVTGTTVAGVLVYPVIYEIDPATGDYNPIFNGSGTTSEYTIQTSDIPATANVSNPVKVTLPVTAALQGGKEYIIAVGHYGGTDPLVIANSPSVDASAYTTFLLDGTDNTWYYLTSTPMIRANFDPTVGIEENEIISVFQAYPNPSNGLTTLAYELTEASDVRFEVRDMTGKVVFSDDLGFVATGAQSYMFNTAILAAGTYTYTLVGNNFSATKQLVVTK